MSTQVEIVFIIYAATSLVLHFVSFLNYRSFLNLQRELYHLHRSEAGWYRRFLDEKKLRESIEDHIISGGVIKINGIRYKASRTSEVGKEISNDFKEI